VAESVAGRRIQQEGSSVPSAEPSTTAEHPLRMGIACRRTPALPMRSAYLTVSEIFPLETRAIGHRVLLRARNRHRRKHFATSVWMAHRVRVRVAGERRIRIGRRTALDRSGGRNWFSGSMRKEGRSKASPTRFPARPCARSRIFSPRRMRLRRLAPNDRRHQSAPES
jgi:hypothetical protein